MPTRRRTKRKAAVKASAQIGAAASACLPTTQKKSEDVEKDEEYLGEVSDDESVLHGPCNSQSIGADPDPRFVFYFCWLEVEVSFRIRMGPKESE